MGVTVDLRVLELLASRLCHELISPVGAINNGIELMDEEDPTFVKEATKLVASSARTAGHRLNFYRFAYGSARSGSGRDAALGLLDGGKVGCVWDDAASALPVEWQRLACNLVVLAAEALPRGGKVQVSCPGTKQGVVVKAEGVALNLPSDWSAAFGSGLVLDDLTARNVHVYYTALLAGALGARVTLTEPSQGQAVLTAAG